jgi:peptidoglycan/xylan/chitin deacetylase (PgdA/CDA1 family)
MFKKNRIILLLVSVFLGLILLSISILPKNYVVPILMYHSINPESDAIMKSLIVKPHTFKRQIKFLKDHGYNILPLETLAGLIKENKILPRKSLAITFDDGYKDFYTYAFPVLVEYKVPATMFIIVDEVGRKQNDRLSWDEIKIMQASGLITFGSHSINAEPLVNLKTEEELRVQIFDSKKILEKRLNCPINMFSYAEGLFNKHIRDLVIQAGYKLAVATKTGPCYSSKDVFALKRLRISEKAGNLFYLWIKVSGYHSFFKDRRCK